MSPPGFSIRRTTQGTFGNTMEKSFSRRYRMLAPLLPVPRRPGHNPAAYDAVSLTASSRTGEKLVLVPSPPANLAQTGTGTVTQVASSSELEQEEEEELFQWTSLAAKVLLEVRFINMKDKFHGTRNSAQLKSLWIILASDVSRLSDITVKPTQCKSKIKHMRKQYTAYRVAQNDTGNRTRIALREPQGYATMCNVWAGASGMQTEAFYPSDVGHDAAGAYQGDLESDRVDELSHHVGDQADVDTDEAEEAEEGQAADDRSQGWRSERPAKRRKCVTLAESVMAVHGSMEKIAATFASSRNQTTTVVEDHSNAINNAILRSLDNLTQSVQAQTALLMELVSELKGGARPHVDG